MERYIACFRCPNCSINFRSYTSCNGPRNCVTCWQCIYPYKVVSVATQRDFNHKCISNVTNLKKKCLGKDHQMRCRMFFSTIWQHTSQRWPTSNEQMFEMWNAKDWHIINELRCKTVPFIVVQMRDRKESCIAECISQPKSLNAFLKWI